MCTSQCRLCVNKKVLDLAQRTSHFQFVSYRVGILPCIETISCLLSTWTLFFAMYLPYTILLYRPAWDEVLIQLVFKCNCVSENQSFYHNRHLKIKYLHLKFLT